MPNHIKAWRRFRRFKSQQALAAAIEAKTGHKTDKTQISKLERGQRKLTQEWIDRLAAALDCTAGELFNPPPASPDEAACDRNPQAGVKNGLRNGDHPEVCSVPDEGVEMPYDEMERAALNLLLELPDGTADRVVVDALRMRRARKSTTNRPTRRA